MKILDSGLGVNVLCLLLLNTEVESKIFGSNLTSKLKKKEGKGRLFDIHGGSQVVVQEAPPLAVTCAHWMTAEECLQSLQVSSDLGLSSNEAVYRFSQYGLNELPKPKQKSLLKLVLEQFEDKLVQILLAVAVLSSVLAAMERDMHAFTEPAIILAILFINALVGVLQSQSAESSLEALKKLQPDTCIVLRDGLWRSEFPANQLVPGDIIHLRVGDKVPADSRVLHLKTSSLSVNESPLTGESASVLKSTEPVEAQAPLSGKGSMLFSGTLVTSGSCYALVTATGGASEVGGINAGVQAAQETQTKTPLAEKLDEFGGQLTKLIGAICLGVWAVSYPKFSSPHFASSLHGAAYYAKIAVALGVAAIPEGLPAIITLCLSLGTRRMAERNVIVRRLASVETLGCTTVICTDKTGTLTTNKMTVKSLVTFSNSLSFHKTLQQDSAPTPNTDSIDPYKPTEELKAPEPSSPSPAYNPVIEYMDKSLCLVERGVEGVSYDPRGHIEGIDQGTMRQSRALQLFAIVASLCNEAELEYKGGEFTYRGEPTEAALKVLVEKMGGWEGGMDKGAEGESSMERVLCQHGGYWRDLHSLLGVMEFSRDRKCMSVLVKPTGGASKGGNMLLTKGAAEMVVEKCSHIMLEDGSVVQLTPSIREVIMKRIKDLSMRPLRCLALAYKQGAGLGDLNQIDTTEQAANQLRDTSRYSEIEKDMVLLGMCGIKDPPRPEVPQAIERCREGGIRVIMITGDAKDTAVSIAKEVRIFDEQTDLSVSAFTGREFFSLSEEEQLAVMRSGNKVICRAEPRDKQLLISMLERLDEIPAMTGDGVNDAPALQQAAIGIAMGITGTEVAKAASDMILVDDNFNSIVKAVEEGRNIFSNMQAFVCFLISCNIGEVVTIFLSSLLGMPEPLTPLHLLWVNLVTDGPPATALGFNPPDPKAMRRPPRPRHESLLSPWLLTRYLITGSYVGLATVGAFVWWFLDKGVSWRQLLSWGDCETWPLFAHGAEAPNWPGKPCEIFTMKHLGKPRAMSLSVLVSIEMLKALSAVSLDQSLFRVPFWLNKWLFPAVLLPFALHLVVLYTPVLSSVFGLSALTGEEWKVIAMFALPVLLLEEVLKFVGRRVNKHKHETQKKLL